MSQINVNNLTFCYEGGIENIFENVSLSIDSDWKLGLVGRNGRGKTTFLKLLMGDLEYSGKISSSVSFDYFPFEIEDKSQNTIDIIMSLDPSLELWQFVKELTILGVSEDCLNRPFDTLSGGEQAKVLLAALFLKENNFLLIDEPTNNLDLEARKTLSKYLKSKKSFIIISHDRSFLDGAVDHILSINRANIEVMRGNFSVWLDNKEKRDAFEIAENEKLKNEIGRLRQSAKQSGEWSQKGHRESTGNSRDEGLAGFKEFHRKKAGKLDSQVKVMEKRQNRAIEEKSALLKNIERVDNLSLTPLVHHSERLAEISDLSINYGDRVLFDSFNLSINQGERIALLGKNGCGKSSILKLLISEVTKKSKAKTTGENILQDIPHSGKINLASRLKISYVSQDTSYLSGYIKDFALDNDLDETKFMTILAKLDFSKESLNKEISTLSSGQKKKILIAKSLCESAHLYIWDEPLSYIDILSRLQIEDLILNSSITMIFVEHDAAFIDKIATQKVKL